MQLPNRKIKKEVGEGMNDRGPDVKAEVAVGDDYAVAIAMRRIVGLAG